MGCVNVWGRRLSMGATRVYGAGKPIEPKDMAMECDL